MMWKFLVICAFAVLILVGCSRSWNYPELMVSGGEEVSPSALQCRECHEGEYDSWENTKHADASRMEKLPHKQLRECGACHDNLSSHTDEPAVNVPPVLSEMGKSEQNTVCGKCHYNQKLFGRKAINPDDKHALFMSVGLEGKKRQIACLDCHSGHEGKSDMLRSIRAHTCFKCHKEAIVTMGVFQPFNYVFVGKVCLGCHPPHGGSAAGNVTRMTAGILVTCVICHPTGLWL